ncbi:hypothetical protein NL676_033729 [Syzygium grande]|nr:hypothetical protein NL676_033729 [Syzygium grande]
MASALVGDDLAWSTSSRRSWASSSHRRWGAASVREAWQAQPDVFSRSWRREDDEEELRWAAIERLPTFDRLRKGVLKRVLDEGKVVHARGAGQEAIDGQYSQSGRGGQRKVPQEAPRKDRSEHLSIEGDVYIGSGALPTLVNATMNTIEVDAASGAVRRREDNTIASTCQQARQGFKGVVSGKVTYCGHELDEFIPQRTCAYISQHDLHYGEMTVRETLDFSGRCLGVGTRYEMLAEILRREKETGIKPDPEIDAFMKATAVAGQEASVVTDYIIKILGLDICADILVGDEMRRGISGGQKKCLMTGEMFVGPAKALFMDEISTGLHSSTTFQIVRCMRQMVHIMDVTMVISLLQPAPETFDLFDNLILLSKGQIFFEYMGFKCPERNGVADFLQEVTSKKDQEHYRYRNDQPYQFISIPDFVHAFDSFRIGEQLSSELRQNSFVCIFKTTQITILSLIALTVFLRTEMHHCFFSLINVMFNGLAELAMTVFRLPVFYKQRDFLFYPAWAFGLPIWVLRIPPSFMESGIWIILTYYTIGFAPAASRFFRQFLAFFGVHQMALSLFRFIAAVGRTQVVASTLGTFTLLMVFVPGGFIVSKNDIEPWMIWSYYISPMMYGQNAIVMNECFDKRWSAPNLDPRINESTVSKVLLKSRGFLWRIIGIDMAVKSTSELLADSEKALHRGMVLPFQPLSLAFNHVNYYVDMPDVSHSF